MKILALVFSSFLCHAEEELHDPLEELNRGILEFNLLADGLILKPAATIYRNVIPDPLKDNVSNFLSNLSLPLTVIYDLLQGNPEQAADDFSRFFINSTLGVAGLFDPAQDMGFEHHQENFGKTLAAADVSSGPYLMLPLLGPSNGRDLVGRIVDYFADPFNIVTINQDRKNLIYWRQGLNVLVKREQNLEFIDDLKASSLDFYAALRSAYQQNQGQKNDDTPQPDDHE